MQISQPALDLMIFRAEETAKKIERDSLAKKIEAHGVEHVRIWRDDKDDYMRGLNDALAIVRGQEP